MPKNIASLADQYLRDPVQVAVTPVATTAERVTQEVIFAHTGAKQALLNHILRDPAIERVLVFTRTKHGADRVVRGLEKVGINASAIHGNKSQPQRERALAAFKDGSCRVLVATDIAARGIDVEAVSHVINYDLPNVPESYVHRIGRTARAGANGLAISFCNDEEKAYLRDIERTTRQKIPVGALPRGLQPAVAPGSGRHRPGRGAPSGAERPASRSAPGPASRAAARVAVPARGAASRVAAVRTVAASGRPSRSDGAARPQDGRGDRRPAGPGRSPHRAARRAPPGSRARRAAARVAPSAGWIAARAPDPSA